MERCGGASISSDASATQKALGHRWWRSRRATGGETRRRQEPPPLLRHPLSPLPQFLTVRTVSCRPASTSLARPISSHPRSRLLQLVWTEIQKKRTKKCEWSLERNPVLSEDWLCCWFWDAALTFQSRPFWQPATKPGQSLCRVVAIFLICFALVVMAPEQLW